MPKQSKDVNDKSSKKDKTELPKTNITPQDGSSSSRVQNNFVDKKFIFYK